MSQPTSIDNVPPEIWAEVFEHAQKKPLVEGLYYQTKSTRWHDVPISVSQVCARFRQIAINTPTLWASIAVNLSAPNLKPPLSLTKLWLERSRNSPLSIFIHNLNGLDLKRHPEKRECITALLAHIGRWREATIEWSVETDSDFWSSMGIVNHAPLLETLILKLSVYEHQIKKQLLPSMLWAGSPKFRKLVVVLYVASEHYSTDDEYSPWTMSNHIPYEQITHLRLDTEAHEIISCDEVISIFKHAANLVCCFIKGISDFDYYPPSDTQERTPVLLNYLRHIYLEPADDSYYVNDVSVTKLLELITAPALVSLTLVHESNFHFDVYQAFIQRSSCALEELNFIHTDISIHRTLACMELVTSSLRRLHVGHFEISSPSLPSGSDEFLTNMTRWDPATNTFALCPNLEQLSVWAVWPPFDNKVGHKEPPGLSLIAQMLESRLRRPPGGPGNTLKNLLIPSRWDGGPPPKLQALCKDPFGLRIGFNNNMGKDGTRKSLLWQRFAYEW